MEAALDAPVWFQGPAPGGRARAGPTGHGRDPAHRPGVILGPGGAGPGPALRALRRAVPQAPPPSPAPRGKWRPPRRGLPRLLATPAHLLPPPYTPAVLKGPRPVIPCAPTSHGTNCHCPVETQEIIRSRWRFGKSPPADDSDAFQQPPARGHHFPFFSFPPPVTEHDASAVRK